MIVLISITVFVIETLPYFGSVFVHASDSSKNITSEDLRQEMQIFSDVTPNDCLLIIDNACNVYFFIEFMIKLVASPDKRKFFKSPLVVTELLCLVPYYIGILIVMAHPEPIKVFLMIRVLFATRVLRIFRIFVLMKHFMALKILIYTIRASTKELFLLLVVLIIGVVIFACIEYYMEIFSNPVGLELEHIPLAFWWALITMTTVGYGDVVPKSGLGYLIGGFCAISGVLVIALSVPVIVKNFTIYYTHAQSREKLKLRKKKFEQTEKWQRLKAGLRSKLKSGALQSALNGIKKKNVVNPKDPKTAPKVSFLKLGGNNKPTEDTGSSMPNTARDIILEDVSEANGNETNETSVDSTVIATANIENGTVAQLNGGHNLSVKNKNNVPPKNQVRSKFFGGSFKSAKIVRNGKKNKDIEMLTPKAENHSDTSVT